MTYNSDDNLKNIMNPKSGSGAHLIDDKRKSIKKTQPGSQARRGGKKANRGGNQDGDCNGNCNGNEDGEAIPSQVLISELGSDVRVAEILDCHRGSVWRFTREDPTFPRPIKLSRGATRWRLSEIYAWIAAKASA